MTPLFRSRHITAQVCPLGFVPLSAALRKARKRAVAAKAKAKPTSRRAHFSMELDRLHSDAVGGELQSDSLMATPPHLLRTVQN